MNKEIIELTKESIKNCGDNRTTIVAKINRLEMEVRDAERELFKVDNVKQSLEAALERLEEADEKEKAGMKIEEANLEKKALEKLMGMEGDIGLKIPEEAILTDEEKAEEALKKADRLIAAGKKAMKEEKKGWELCSRCNKNKIAPWNAKGICSKCQIERKPTRPYSREK